MTGRITQQDVARKVEEINQRLQENNSIHRLLVGYDSGWCKIRKTTLDGKNYLIIADTKRNVYEYLKSIQYRTEL